ncbi:MAG TPA: thiosulfate oxidation carrier protein SoxY [Bryobacterales bacterium]|nr:thiosulfate oxidation carrier protein SoxY [Bryobacterales bacterium]
MEFTRRETLAMGAGAAALAVLPVRAMASVEEEIADFTGGAEVTEGGVTLNAPEIAENGNTVPISFDAPGAVAVRIIATGNPSPKVATVNFGPLSGSSSAALRIRLAKTQDVYAIAKMADGSFKSAKAAVKVTIGGCGG